MSVGSIRISCNSKPSIRKGCVTLTYKVLSSRANTLLINFTAITTDSNTYYRHINAFLSLSLLPCLLGFELTKKQCDCDPLLHSNDVLSPVNCDIDAQVIHIPANSQLWFGCDSHESDTENKNQCHLAVNLHCSHYCTPYNHSVNMSTLNHFDDQCLPG